METEENKTLYLVDGSGYIFRAFYAIQPLSNNDGLPTNALFGFTRMLVKLLRDTGAKYIAMAFDTGAPTFRHQMYDQYKANRAECPAELVPQMPYFRKISQALNVPTLEQEGVEADDIIGTIVRACADGFKVVVVSGDKDLCQLVDDRVEVWDAMRDIHYDVAGVKEKFGVSPEQIIDYLTLIGDSSDNVPGVKGIGPKTAQVLLGHFGSLDELLKRNDEVTAISGLRGAAGVKQKIDDSKETIALSRELVTLKCDVSPFSEIDVKDAFLYRGPNSELLHPLFSELEFEALYDSLKDFKVAAPTSQQIEKNYRTISAESLDVFLRELSDKNEFAFDTETDSLDRLNCELVGMSFSWADNEACYLPLGSVVNPESNLDRNRVLEGIRAVMANPNQKKIGLNCKFDLAVLRTHGVEVSGLDFDSMLASYVINPDKRQHNLAALTKVHLREDMVSFETLTKGKDSIAEIDLAQVSKYACHDADAAWRLKDVLNPLLGEDSEKGLRRIFETIEMPLIPILEQMERVGILIDMEMLARLSDEFGSEVERLEAEIYGLAGEQFNLNSPKQLSAILFETLGIPSKGLKKTQSGISTDASVLEKLAPEHEIVAKILEYREIFKLKSTYLESLRSLANPKTHRIHTTYNQAVAATGRLSSSDPNLQNIPIRNPRGRKIREAFIAKPGTQFISADYSQIELRVLAHLSGDENLRNTYLRGEDIHLATAKELLGAAIASAEELKDLRRVAKTINFGIVYGMSAFRLANELGISRTNAQRYIDGYFNRYPKVREYFDLTTKEMEQRGYVETLFGRRRYLKDIDTSGRDAGYAVRSLLNAPIQGTAAEIIKIAMISLAKKLKPFGEKAQMILQVHDELVFEVDENMIPSVKALIVEDMEGAVQLEVPLKVDVRVANRWG